MPRPINRVHNQETGEVIDREMNDEEYQLYLEAEFIRTQQQAEAATKAAQRQTLLTRIAGFVADSAEATGLKWQAPAGSSGPAFLAYRSADTAFVNGVWTKTPFNAESFDTDNCFDSTTNYRFTPNKAGYYNIQTQVRLSPNTGIWAQLRLYKNGSAVRGAIEEPSTSGKCIPITTLIYMNGSSDYLEVYYYIEGTGNLQGDSTNFPTWFDGVWIRS